MFLKPTLKPERIIINNRINDLKNNTAQSIPDNILPLLNQVNKNDSCIFHCPWKMLFR